MSLSPKVRLAVKQRDEWRCVRCAMPDYLEIHHIVARRDGGGDELANLVLLCHFCHSEWTWLVEPRVNLTWSEWLETPSYLGLLSFWQAMRRCADDGTVVFSNGASMILPALEVERAHNKGRAARGPECFGRPTCRMCGLEFPKRLPMKLDEYPEYCRTCDPDPRPLERVYTPGELREWEDGYWYGEKAA